MKLFSIRKASPLTYQILGNLETIFITILGVTIFNKTIDSRNIIRNIIADRCFLYGIEEKKCI